MTDLIDRLNEMSGCQASGPQSLRNPDGPEAAVELDYEQKRASYNAHVAAGLQERVRVLEERNTAEEIERLTARVAELEEGLKPFAKFGRNNTDKYGWSGLHCEGERIRIWFSPFDFRRARNLLSKGG